MIDRDNEGARAEMLRGAHLAGCAIENSMLGAAHALANPLTSHFGVAHGFAVGLMLPHVVRFNGEDQDLYAGSLGQNAATLALRLEQLLDAGHIRRRLSDHDIPAEALPMLAADAAKQWTATFNPRATGEADMLMLYRLAF